MNWVLLTTLSVSAHGAANLTGSWYWVRTSGYHLDHQWCATSGHGHAPWPALPQTWNITMNLTHHGDGNITGACIDSGGGNLTGYTVDTESVQLMVLSRRHFPGSYIKSTGVNAFFLGRLESPNRARMAFTNDNGQSCSAVTLTRIGLEAFRAPVAVTQVPAQGRVHGQWQGQGQAQAAPVAPPFLNCSWVAQWVNGSKMPFAALSLRQTGSGNGSQPLSPPVQGACTAAAGAGAGSVTGAGACTVLRAAQIPGPTTVVQVTMRTAGTVVALTSSLCPGGACGMAQWVSGDGSAGQLTLLPSADSACSAPAPTPPAPQPTPTPTPPTPLHCLQNGSWYAWKPDWDFTSTSMTAKAAPSYSCSLGAIMKRCLGHSATLPPADVRCYEPGATVDLRGAPRPFKDDLALVDPV